jgi:hypothetical protein
MQYRSPPPSGCSVPVFWGWLESHGEGKQRKKPSQYSGFMGGLRAAFFCGMFGMARRPASEIVQVGGLIQSLDENLLWEQPLSVMNSRMEITRSLHLVNFAGKPTFR